MNKLSVSIILILIILLAIIFIKHVVSINIYKQNIEQISAENKELISRISSAENYIDMQNMKIVEFGQNIKKAEYEYNRQIKNINEKYAILQKKYKNIEKLKCNEILTIIDKNQRRFIYD